MSDPAGSKAAEGGSTTFWKTLPGILTGVAALVAAIGGLIVVLVQVFGTPGQDPPADTGARSSPDTSISETTAAPRSSAPEQTAGGELHRDRIEMKDADFADLETGKVGSPPDNDFYLHGVDQIIAYYGMTPASGPMEKQNCVTALSDRDDRGVSQLSKVTDDQWLCVQTKEGHLAGMRIVQRPGPGRQTIAFEYVLWK